MWLQKKYIILKMSKDEINFPAHFFEKQLKKNLNENILAETKNT